MIKSRKVQVGQPYHLGIFKRNKNKQKIAKEALLIPISILPGPF